MYRVCYKCGRFRYRVDQCSHANPSEGEPLTQLEQRNIQPPILMRNTLENPFGPWLMPAHVRRRMEQAQKRMSRRSEPLAANKAMNLHIEKEVQAQRHQKVGNSYTVHSRYTTGANRGEQEVPDVSPDGKLRNSVDIAQKYKFSILDEVNEEDDIVDKLSTLKQIIMDIPSPSGTGGKAYVKNPGNKIRGHRQAVQGEKMKEVVQDPSNSIVKAKHAPKGIQRPDPLKELDNNRPTQNGKRQRLVVQPDVAVGPISKDHVRELPTKKTKGIDINPAPNRDPQISVASGDTGVDEIGEVHHGGVDKNMEVSALQS